MNVTPFQPRSAFFGSHQPYDQGVYGMYRGRAYQGCKPVSHTLIDLDASRPFSCRTQQTDQPYLYSEHTPPYQYAAGEQSQDDVQDSESGEEAQERNQAQTGGCCTRAGPCCLPALAAKAFSLAQGVGKNFDLRMKCGCGNQFQISNFSNKD
jgi:hypothetical protein